MFHTDARASAASPAAVVLALFRDLHEPSDARLTMRPNTVAGDGQPNRWGSFGYAAAALQEAQSHASPVADVRRWDSSSLATTTLQQQQQQSLSSAPSGALQVATGVQAVFGTTPHQQDAHREAYYTTSSVPTNASRYPTSCVSLDSGHQFAFSPPGIDNANAPNKNSTSVVVIHWASAKPPTPPPSQPRLIPVPDSPTALTGAQASFETAPGHLSLASPLSLRPNTSCSDIGPFSVPERLLYRAPSPSAMNTAMNPFAAATFRSTLQTQPIADFSDATTMRLRLSHSDGRAPHTAGGELLHFARDTDLTAPPLLPSATSTSTPSPQFSSPLLETPNQRLPELQADTFSTVFPNPSIVVNDRAETQVKEFRPECAPLQPPPSSSSSSCFAVRHPDECATTQAGGNSSSLSTVQSFICDGQPTPCIRTHINTTHHTPASTSFWQLSSPSSSSALTNPPQHPQQQQPHLLRQSVVTSQEHHTSGFQNTAAAAPSSSSSRVPSGDSMPTSANAMDNHNNGYNTSPSTSQQHIAANSSPESATANMAQNAMYPMATPQGTASAPANPSFATNMNVSPHQTSMRDSGIASSSYYHPHVLQHQQQQAQQYSPQQNYSQLSQYADTVSPYSSQHSFHESSSYSSGYHQPPNSAGSYNPPSLGHGRSDSMNSWTMGENTSSSEQGSRRTKSGNRKATDEPILAPGEEAVPRPSPSYAGLIGEALLMSEPPHQLYVSEISESIKARYQYYRQNPSKLYNGVRHQTSMCKAFVKLPRPFGDQSGGARKWAIREGCQTWFYDSNYHPPASVQSAVKASKKSKHKQFAIGTGATKNHKNNVDGVPFGGLGPSSGKAWDPVAHPLPARLRPGPPKERPVLPIQQPPTATAGPSHQIPRVPQTATAGPSHHGLIPSQYNQPANYTQPYPYPVPTGGYTGNWAYPPHPHHYPAAVAQDHQAWRPANNGFALGEPAFERSHRNVTPNSGSDGDSARSMPRGSDTRMSPGPEVAYNNAPMDYSQRRPSTSPLSTPPSGTSSLSHEA